MSEVKPRKNITAQDNLTTEEQATVLEAAKKYDEVGDQLPYEGFAYQTTALLLDTGMHISVVPTLKENNVFGDYLQWVRPKNKEHVSLPLSKRVQPFIREYVKQKRPQWRQYYNFMFGKIGELAGIDGLCPLNFRHTFAVNRLDEGYDLGDLQKLMGVKNLKSLAHYTMKSKRYLDEKYRGKGW